MGCGAEWGCGWLTVQRRGSGGLVMVRGIGVVATVAVFVAGCTSVVSGQAVRDAALTPNADGAIVALLDHGNYPITPSAALGVAGAKGPLIQSQALAEDLVLPSDVDPQIADSGNLNGLGAALPLPTPGVVSEFVIPGTEQILTAHQYVAGFAASRLIRVSTGTSKAMTTMLLQFPDPQTAADAAGQLAGVSGPTVVRTPLPLEAHPDALASTFEMGGGHIVESYTARGPFVLYQFVNSEESVAVAASLASATLDRQIPRVDAVAPTAPTDLGALPRDPTGVYAATLRKGEDSLDFTDGAYGPHGGLAYESNTVDMGALYADTGVDVVTRGVSVVYRTSDPEAARRFTVALTKDATAHQGVSAVTPVLGLPQSRCYSTTSGQGSEQHQVFQCVATAGRFAFRVFSQQRVDVLQRTAAQYLMLAGR